MSLRVVRIAATQPLLRLPRQPDRQCIRHFRDRILHGEDVGEVFVKIFRPQLTIVLHIQKARGDSQTIAVTLDRPVEHG